jgi:hypothetical protein
MLLSACRSAGVPVKRTSPFSQNVDAVGQRHHELQVLLGEHDRQSGQGDGADLVRFSSGNGRSLRRFD